MIPKTIHYCWFGNNEKPKITKKCIASWKKYCPEYDIIEWNEQSIDLASCPQYVQDAYAAKKYAYVTDYIRLQVLYDHGGFYLDTDVELIKSLNILCDNLGVIGFENDSFVNSGQILGAAQHHLILKEMMAFYEQLSFYHADGSINLVGCPHVNTDVLEEHGMIRNGSEQIVADFHVYPADWFNPLDSTTGILNKTANTVSIHWYSMSWISPIVRIRVKLLRLVRRFLIKILRSE